MPADVDSGDPAVIWIEQPGGRVAISQLPDGHRRVVVHPDTGTFVSQPECLTTYPVDLIRRIVEIKSLGWVCDEIARDEDPDYVALDLRYALFGYVPAAYFRGGRLLDFGSGSGASTVVLARMLPDTEIVGIELQPDFIEIARLRAAHHGLPNLTFLQSPTPETLPDGLGNFDFVNLGAVYEHLLPAERPRVCAQLWDVMQVGGVIFVNQLPYRYYPLEDHTTGLPAINFLPDRLTHRLATMFSPRIQSDATWEWLLRAGIRGGTAQSVRRDLLSRGGDARMLAPSMTDIRDHADLWYGLSNQKRPSQAKQAMRSAFRAASRVSGRPVAPVLNLAFQKQA